MSPLLSRSHARVIARALATTLTLALGAAYAQDADDGDAAAHQSGGHAPGVTRPPATADTRTPGVPTLAGQYAFATIAEIVDLLERDPVTDWSRVDLEGLRQHLIDMDRVTLGARVRTEDTPGGARFEVSAERPEVVESIRRMSGAHAADADHGPGGATWRYAVEERPDGVAFTVSGDGSDAIERIRGLGFIGVLVAGTHHPRHHLAIARGENPHDH